MRIKRERVWAAWGLIIGIAFGGGLASAWGSAALLGIAIGVVLGIVLAVGLVVLSRRTGRRRQTGRGDSRNVGSTDAPDSG